MDLHSGQRTGNSGGSNLNNMINNFSKINNGAVGTCTNGSNNRHIFISRTQSDNSPTRVNNLSKSMGTTSFIMGSRSRVSDVPIIPDPLNIRHAGYLLKRSNFPYAMTSNTLIVSAETNLSEDGVHSIMEPPSIENVMRYFPLPNFDHLDADSDSLNNGTAKENDDGIETEKAPIIANRASNCGTHSEEDIDVCFCSPVIQYFESLFGQYRVSNAVEVTKSKYRDTTNQSPHRTLRKQTQPLPIAPTPNSPSYLRSESSTKRYNITLKPPARSTPVPISPNVSRPEFQRTGSASQIQPRRSSSVNLSRSFSNGTIIKIASTDNASVTCNKAEEKDTIVYPPPPADFIDPKDGHIWRAKYCVLEEGILYFYRSAEEGESNGAQEERMESSRIQSLDAMEGTGFDYVSKTNSPTRQSVAGQTVTSPSRTIRMLSEKVESRQDLTDLSKSPMPYKKSDIFEYATNFRSGSTLSETSSTPLHHSHSTNTFNFDDPDILWEKRVALDCVGAVRSSEQDHGDHAFELLAFGMDGRTDEMSNSLSGRSQNEFVDRLVLRAGTSDDMNNWLFQFHRSLSSYMQRMVQQHNKHRPNSPLLHSRRPTPIHGARQSSSPTTNSFGGSLNTSIPGSLSHGHGRNAMYRRQVRDNKDESLLISPVSTPGGGSSPVDPTKPRLALTLQNMSSPIAKEDAAPKKYIPPHLRNKEGSKKYVPPHLRQKAPPEESLQKDLLDAVVILPSLHGEEPLVDRNTSNQENYSISDSGASSLLSRQMDEDSISIAMNIRLGGCADPTAVVGSILDHHFINRKASVVGNVRLEAYGGRGGGAFEQSLNSDSVDNSGCRVLKWEVGAASECGVRNSNEDSFVIINNLDELIRSQGLVSFADQDFGFTKQQGLYAIFDGHVGNQAARFGAEKFPDILIEEQSSLASRDSASMTSIETRADSILRSSFERLDKDFCNLCTLDGRNWDSGSTALVAFIVDDVVSLANLGDCRAVACRVISSSKVDLGGWDNLDADSDDERNGRLFWKEMTEIHSPILPEERARIEQANGWIINETEIPTGQLHRMDFFDKDVVEIVKRCFADRLKQHRSDPVRQIQIARTCGDLAVSRAIGDRDFKAAYNMPQTPRNPSSVLPGETNILSSSWEGPPVFIYPEGHSGRFKGDLVSHDPDIKFFKVGQRGVVDEFLLMACDGLWDVMDGDDAVRIAKDLLFDKKLSAKDGAARLAELAKHLGSSDNITVVLIRFYWEKKDT